MAAPGFSTSLTVEFVSVSLSLSLRHYPGPVDNGSPLSVVDLATSSLHLRRGRSGLEEVYDGVVAVVDPLGVGRDGSCALVGHQPSGCGGGLEGGLVGWSLRGGRMGGLMYHPLSRGRIRGLWYVVLVSECLKNP